MTVFSFITLNISSPLRSDLQGFLLGNLFIILLRHSACDEPFSIAIFKILFLSLTFNSLTVMLVSLFILVGGHWSSTVCISISFLRFGKFSAFIFSISSLCVCVFLLGLPQCTHWPLWWCLRNLLDTLHFFAFFLSLCFYLMISGDLCSRFVILLPSQLCFLISGEFFSSIVVWKFSMKMWNGNFQFHFSTPELLLLFLIVSISADIIIHALFSWVCVALSVLF